MDINDAPDAYGGGFFIAPPDPQPMNNFVEVVHSRWTGTMDSFTVDPKTVDGLIKLLEKIRDGKI